MLLWHRSRRAALMTRATRVAAIAIDPNKRWLEYAWTAESRVRVIGVGGAASDIDTRTGIRKIVPMLNSPGLGRVNGISPDGSCLVTEYVNQKTSGRGLTFHKLDGSDSFRTPTGQYSGLIWTPDGMFCAADLYGGKDSSRHVIWDMRTHRQWISERISQRDQRILAVIGPQTLITAKVKRGQPDRCFLMTAVGPGIHKPLRVNLPPNADVGAVELSHERDRLFWWLMIRKVRPSWLARMFRRYFGQRENPNDPDYTTEGLWISKPDGSDMHELGSVKAEYAPAGFEKPHWLPDGRRISFLYRHGLYVVPVD